MKVGFTGTRDGMTEQQKDAFRNRFESVEEFHHGCCLGADEAAAVIMNVYGVKIVGHPPKITTLLSEYSLRFCDEIHNPLPYLDRNKRIVDACDVLVACPKGPEEQRSGTWSTVRYARKKGKQIVIIWPNGQVTSEPAK